MTLIRIAARALTGSTYALLGADAFQQPGARPEMAASTLAAARKVVPLPEDDTLLVKANAGVQVVGGSLLALGIFPRLAATALAASLVPTTVAGHAFWEVEDEAARKGQRVQFLKDTALLGGLLFATLDAGSKRGARRAARSKCCGDEG